MGGLKLNPNDPKDREFMMKHKDRSTGKTLMELHLSSGSGAAKVINDSINREQSKGSRNDPRLITDEQELNVMGSRRTFTDNQWFDSKYEGDCWMILKDLQRIGMIEELDRTREFTHFEFVYNKIRIAQTKLDFAFTITKTRQRVLADSKSPYTVKSQRFVWQCRMMRAWYDIEVMVFLQGTTSIKDEIEKRISEYDENKCLH